MPTTDNKNRKNIIKLYENLNLSSFTIDQKIFFIKLFVFLICLKFLYNAVQQVLLKSYVFGITYLVITIALPLIVGIFLKGLRKKLKEDKESEVEEKSNSAEKLLSVGLIMLFSFSAAQGQEKNIFRDTLKGNSQKEYLDTIYLGADKNCFIDIKGFNYTSGDIGSGLNGVIKVAVQEDSKIIKLHATKAFKETNLFLAGEDTTIQFLIRYKANPSKNYYSYFLPFFESAYNRKLDSLSQVALLMKDRQKDTLVIINNPINSKDTTIRIHDDVFEKILKQEPNCAFGDIAKGIKMGVYRLYHTKDYQFYGITLYNETKEDFVIEQIETEVFEAAARKIVAHKSGEDYGKVIDHLESSDQKKLLPGHGKMLICIATDRTNIREDQYIRINIKEQGGGGRLLRAVMKKVDMQRSAKINITIK